MRIVRWQGGVVGALVVALSLPVGAAETLVVKGADGKIAPGVAKSWTQSGDALVLTLGEGADAAAWVKLIEERLASVKVTLAKNQLTLSGVPAAALLDQLSTLTPGGDADPLAALAGVGGTPTDAPEGGGSIRASKPTPFAMGNAAIKEHDPKERFEAEIVEVKRGDFPAVSLKLKMRSPANRQNALAKKLYYGKVIEVMVAFNPGAAGVDVNDATNRRNLVAWYLEKGDRVSVHLVAMGGEQYVVDYLVRTR